MDAGNYLEGRVLGSILYSDKSYALYCKDGHSSQDPTWLEIFALCDAYTWIGIIGSAIAAGIICKNLRYSLDVIFILLGQQQQCRWRREGKDILLGTFILSMMFVNQDYLSTLTNQVTAPLQNYKIPSLQELFGDGYRLPAPNENVLMIYNMFLQHRYKKLKMGNKTIQHYGVITKKMDISDGIESFWFGVMSREKFVIPAASKDLQLLQKGNLFKQNRILNYTCYIVKSEDEDDDQHLYKRDIWYLFRGRMKYKAYWLIQRLHHAAIYNYWRAERDRAELRSSNVKRTCNENPGQCIDNTLFQPLKWNSRFKIVFYWHLAICAAAYITFLVEKLFISRKKVPNNPTRTTIVKTYDHDHVILSKLGEINIVTASILGINSFTVKHNTN